MKLLSAQMPIKRRYMLFGAILGVGLFISVSAAPALAAGNVKVRVVRGDLRLAGDAAANAMTIAPGAVEGKFVITGLNGTRVNGKNAVTVAGVDRNIQIDLVDGDDEVTISDVTAWGDLLVMTGNGKDTVTLSTVEVLEDLEVKTDIGTDQVTLDTVTVGRDTRIETRGGADIARITASLFAEKVEVNLGEAVNVLRVTDTEFLGQVRFEGGTGTDTFEDGGGNEFEPSNPKLKGFEIAQNVATLVQINSCEEGCDSISLANTTVVIQDILQTNTLAYVPSKTKSAFPRLELANLATIVQENFCVDCRGVDQRNIALVIQNINPDMVAMLRGAAPVARLNTVEITQVNTCFDCTEGEQQNFAVVVQNLRIEDCFLYIPRSVNLDVPPVELANIVTVVQDNFCVDCDEVVQDNMVLVIQNINPANIILLPK